MQSIITSYLLQTGKCSLPYIGIFNTGYKSAENDIANKQILPPVEEIVFAHETMPVTPGLLKYAAVKKNISENEAAVELDNFCKEWKIKIGSGAVLHFEFFGSLRNDESGKIIFLPGKGNFYNNPVAANRVLRLNAEHEVLVGDTQTTSAAMNEFYTKEPVVEKRVWRIWAIALFLISLVMLFYSFYKQKFSPSLVGNRINLVIKTAGETYLALSNNDVNTE